MFYDIGAECLDVFFFLKAFCFLHRFSNFTPRVNNKDIDSQKEDMKPLEECMHVIPVYRSLLSWLLGFSRHSVVMLRSEWQASPFFSGLVLSQLFS